MSRPLLLTVGTSRLADSSRGPAATSFLPSSVSVNLPKLSMKSPAKERAFSSHSAGPAYVRRGSSIPSCTPGKDIGTWRLNIGKVCFSAESMEPSIMASIMARVSLIEILSPVPFQPVLTRYALAPEARMRLTSTSAYRVGCNVRKAAPKQAEKVGVGSVTRVRYPPAWP